MLRNNEAAAQNLPDFRSRAAHGRSLSQSRSGLVLAPDRAGRPRRFLSRRNHQAPAGAFRAPRRHHSPPRIFPITRANGSSRFPRPTAAGRSTNCRRMCRASARWKCSTSWSSSTSAKFGLNSTRALHVQIEAKKLAYADVLRYIGDPKTSKTAGQRNALQTICRRARQADRYGSRELRCCAGHASFPTPAIRRI